MDNQAKATPEQIEAWKQQYGIDQVFEISVPLNDENTEFVTGYFRKPNLQAISASAKVMEADPIKSGIIMFDNCWLGGEEKFKNNDEAKMSAIEQLNKLFQIRIATVKNL
jgi:hypothetical protein